MSRFKLLNKIYQDFSKPSTAYALVMLILIFGFGMFKIYTVTKTRILVNSYAEKLIINKNLEDRLTNLKLEYTILTSRSNLLSISSRFNLIFISNKNEILIYRK